MTELKEISGNEQMGVNPKYDEFGACHCNDTDREYDEFDFGCQGCSYLDKGNCWKNAVEVETENQTFTCWELASGLTVWKR